MGGKRADASPHRSQEPRARLDDEPPPPHQRPRGRRQRPSVRHHRLILPAQSTQEGDVGVAVPRTLATLTGSSPLAIYLEAAACRRSWKLTPSISASLAARSNPPCATLLCWSLRGVEGPSG